MLSKIFAAARKRGVASLLELAGIAGVAVAVGFLAGLWWGVLGGSLELIVYSNLMGTPARPGDAP